jgi:hypothetical protein
MNRLAGQSTELMKERNVRTDTLLIHDQREPVRQRRRPVSAALQVIQVRLSSTNDQLGTALHQHVVAHLSFGLCKLSSGRPHPNMVKSMPSIFCINIAAGIVLPAEILKHHAGTTNYCTTTDAHIRPPRVHIHISSPAIAHKVRLLAQDFLQHLCGGANIRTCGAH